MLVARHEAAHALDARGRLQPVQVLAHGRAAVPPVAPARLRVRVAVGLVAAVVVLPRRVVRLVQLRLRAAEPRVRPENINNKSSSKLQSEK